MLRLAFAMIAATRRLSQVVKVELTIQGSLLMTFSHFSSLTSVFDFYNHPPVNIHLHTQHFPHPVVRTSSGQNSSFPSNPHYPHHTCLPLPVVKMFKRPLTPAGLSSLTARPAASRLSMPRVEIIDMIGWLINRVV